MARRSKRRAPKRSGAANRERRRPRSAETENDEDLGGLESAADEVIDETRLAAGDADDDFDADYASGTDELAERLLRGNGSDDEVSEDYGIDNVVGPLEAGLGGGLDQAEEARAGITDEEIARMLLRR